MKCTTLTCVGVGMLLGVPLAAQTVETPTAPTTTESQSIAPSGDGEHGTIWVDTLTGRRVRVVQRSERNGTTVTTSVTTNFTDTDDESDQDAPADDAVGSRQRQRVRVRQFVLDSDGAPSTTDDVLINADTNIEDFIIDTDANAGQEPMLMNVWVNGKGAAADAPHSRVSAEQYDAVLNQLKEQEQKLRELAGTAKFDPMHREQLDQVRNALDSARNLLSEANRVIGSSSVMFFGKGDSGMTITRLRAVGDANVVVVPAPPVPPVPCVPSVPCVPPVPCVPSIPAVPPVPPVPSDVNVGVFKSSLIKFQGDSVSIVDGNNGERVIRIFNLGGNDSTMVIDEVGKDGTRSKVTIFNGPLVLMDMASGKGEGRTRIFVDGDAVDSDIESHVVVISPGRSQDEAPAAKIVDTLASDVETTDAVAVASAGYSLANAVPNPAEGTVTVGFRLPNAGPVKLTLHDENGRLIKTVADREFDSGEHTVSFDAGDLPNGTYFYRLVSGTFAASKALQVVR